MKQYGPHMTTAGIVDRSPHLVDLILSRNKQTLQYRVWVSKTLNDAYGNPDGSGVGGDGPIQILTATAGETFRSPSVIRAGQGRVGDSRRGTTRILFDLDDYSGNIATEVPSDDEVTYLRIQEKDKALGDFFSVAAGLDNEGDPILGPILIVPPVSYYATSRPMWAFDGLAPVGTGCEAGEVPAINVDGSSPNPMFIALPRASSSGKLLNRSEAGNLLISFGVGQSMVVVPPLAEIYLRGSTKHILIASGEDFAIPFTLFESMPFYI